MYFLEKLEITFGQPKQVGFTVYELSNLFMYRTYIKSLQSNFEVNIKNIVMWMLVLAFETDDIVTE